MSRLDAALGYARRGRPVFPCHWQDERRKRPLIEGGFHAATTEEARIREWWRRWPDALIGIPTGRDTGFIVLDIDRKNGVNGFDALDALGRSILPDTPMVHTASGGLHVYFDPSGQEIRNSAGKLGTGLDVRGEGGYVIVPSLDSGYEWDPHQNFDTRPLAPVPIWMTPVEPAARKSEHPVWRRSVALPRYAGVALDNAVHRIFTASAGTQELTLNRESYGIGRLAGSGVVPAGLALDALLLAARSMPAHDMRHPWRATEVERKVQAAFTDGLRRPREAPDARR
jgi:hypothetical protein